MIGGLSKINRYLLAGAGVIGILAAGGSPAGATDVQQLEAAMKAMQAQMEVLQKQVQEAKAAAASAQTAAKTGSGSDLDLKVKWKGAPEFSSSDGKFKFKVRGRLETDYNNINQDTAITTFPDVSATELRRARLGIEGIAFYDVKYVLEVDFAGAAAGSNNGGGGTGFISNDLTSGISVKDAYIQYQGFKIGENPLIFRVGNFKTPNTMEDETSDRFVDTMERASFINAWEIDRQIGFMTAYWADHFGGAAGIWGEGVQSATFFPGPPNGFIGDENVTFAARGKIDPINREVNGVTQVLHFGASVRTRDVGNNQPFLQYRAKGADLNMANFAVQTGRIGDGDTFWGLEAAGLWGPFSLQGEYGHLDVDLPNGTLIRSNSVSGTGGIPFTPNPFLNIPSPEYSGWYIEGSWFFGGHKTYEKEAIWGRPKIDNPMRWGEHSGWGAVQLVGKYDVIDLSDTAFNNAGGCRTQLLWPGVKESPGPAGNLVTPSVAECGEMKTWIVGVNWYLNDYVRLMFDYSQSDLSGYPITVIPPGTSIPAGPKAGFDGATIRGFGMRAQVDW